MKSVVMVIAQNNFRDEESLLPREVLEQAGYKVITAFTSVNKATGSLGVVVRRSHCSTS